MLDIAQLAQGYVNPQASAPPAPIDAAFDKALAGVEMVGAGVLAAYLNARSPAEGKSYHESFGYPTDGVAAIGCILAGFLFRSPHLLRIGIGVGIETGVRYGLQKGLEDRRADQAKQLRGKTKMEVLEGGKQTSSALSKPASEAFEKVANK